MGTSPSSSAAPPSAWSTWQSSPVAKAEPRLTTRLHPGMDFLISTPRPMPPRPPVGSVQFMSTATKDPSGSLRVSDADRDRAIAELSEHPFHFAWL